MEILRGRFLPYLVALACAAAILITWYHIVAQRSFTLTEEESSETVVPAEDY